MPEIIDKYSNLEGLGLVALEPSWVADKLEARRIAAYGIYEGMYHSVEGTYNLIDTGRPEVLLPSPRVIVDAMNRYIGNAPEIVIPPETARSDKEAAERMLRDLIRRERFMEKFLMAKRMGIARGDWAFHIWADPNKPKGSRVSIYPIHPGTLFPIYDPNNIESITGWHIAESVLLDGETTIHRKTYRKVYRGADEESAYITYEHKIFPVDDWGGPDMEGKKGPIRTIQEEIILPAPISQIPIYHIPNNPEEGDIFGRSEMSGFEPVVRAQMQSATDQDTSMALEGLGMYVTDSGQPFDEDGNKAPWNIGPAVVTSIDKGTTFKRVQAVTSIDPYVKHFEFFQKMMERAEGLGDVSTGGTFDVEVAESGVALQLRLGPVLASAQEREIGLSAKIANLLYDLPDWYSAYEGEAVPKLDLDIKFGPKLPVNEEKRVLELIRLFETGLVSSEYVHDQMRKMGRDLPEEDELNKQIDSDLEKGLIDKSTRSSVFSNSPTQAFKSSLSGRTNSNIEQGTL